MTDTTANESNSPEARQQLASSLSLIDQLGTMIVFNTYNQKDQ